MRDEGDRAEVVILACAGLCGYDEALSRLAGIPVLDPVAVVVTVADLGDQTFSS